MEKNRSDPFHLTPAARYFLVKVSDHIIMFVNFLRIKVFDR
jgi:hypothetical protein